MNTLIIAEAGVNHNGKLEIALELVDAAAEAKADVVKFQTFQASKLATATAEKASYQKKGTDSSQSQRDMLESLELKKSWHLQLIERAEKRGIRFASTAFDRDSLAFLSGLKLPFLKIPSGEITNAPLLLEFARTQQPIIMSTGMSTLGDIEYALANLAWGFRNECIPSSSRDIWRNWSQPGVRDSLSERVTLLHCTSQYPASIDSANLEAIQTMKAAFGLPVGYSDHTEGILCSTVAVAKGATVIEKHFTLDRSMTGPDHKASLEPGELRQLVSTIRKVEKSLGDGIKSPHSSEFQTMEVARQRIVAAGRVKAGDIFTETNLTTSRSVSGRLPTEFWEILGTPATKNFEPGDGV